MGIFDSCYYNAYGYRYCNRSGWYHWGRWVVVGVLIVAAVFILSVMACINSRRRRRRGIQPVYGTGWMAPLPKYSAQPAPGHQTYGQGSSGAPQQPPQSGYYAPAPPMYQANTGTTHTTQDVPLQAPPQAYQSGGAAQGYYSGTTQEQYAPPAGPPPGHK